MDLFYLLRAKGCCAAWAFFAALFTYHARNAVILRNLGAMIEEKQAYCPPAEREVRHQEIPQESPQKPIRFTGAPAEVIHSWSRFHDAFEAARSIPDCIEGMCGDSYWYNIAIKTRSELEAGVDAIADGQTGVLDFLFSHPSSFHIVVLIGAAGEPAPLTNGQDGTPRKALHGAAVDLLQSLSVIRRNGEAATARDGEEFPHDSVLLELIAEGGPRCFEVNENQPFPGSRKFSPKQEAARLLLIKCKNSLWSTIFGPGPKGPSLPIIFDRDFRWLIAATSSSLSEEHFEVLTSKKSIDGDGVPSFLLSRLLSSVAPDGDGDSVELVHGSRSYAVDLAKLQDRLEFFKESCLDTTFAHWDGGHWCYGNPKTARERARLASDFFLGLTEIIKTAQQPQNVAAHLLALEELAAAAQVVIKTGDTDS
jgi:hypothetical protein